MKLIKLEGEECMNKEWVPKLVISDMEPLWLVERIFHSHQHL